MATKKEEEKELNELVFIQSRLKAPKNQRNNFGGYQYRSCEDIMEAVKPLLLEVNCSLVVGDEIVMVGDRTYVKATAILRTPSGTEYKNTAYAREPLSKKGSDESQVTGATSSYARKYALNGLFCIDDTKDADALNTSPEYTQQPASKPQSAGQRPATAAQAAQQYRFTAMDADVNAAFGKASTNEHLMAIWKAASPELQANQAFRDAYTKRSNEIKGTKK